jgi:FkbM family methyltransferase
VNPGRPTIDIGANIGFYTFRLAALSPQVLSVEPNPVLARQIKIASSLARIRNVTVIAAACGSDNGQGHLHVPLTAEGVADPGQAHLAVDQEAGTPVPIERLDDLVERARLSDVGFVKIDVEGAEFQVLRGAEGLLSNARPVVLCEIQDIWCARYGNKASDVFSLLNGYGYVANVLKGGTFSQTLHVDPDIVNYVFFPTAA